MGKGLRGGWRLGALALALALSGCHERDGIRVVEARALFDTDVADFGEVPVGEWAELEVGIRNTGYVPFNALEAFTQQGNPSFRVELEGNSKVMPGETKRVKVRFHPLSEGEIADAMAVNTDAEHEPSSPLPLRGRGGPTPIRVSPATVDFETLEVDSDRTLPVTVENPVDLPLTLRVGGSHADQFTPDTITIPPHGKVEINTRFLPHTLGGSTARLDIRACDNCTPTPVGLVGKSVASAFVFDPAPIPFDNIPVHEKTQSFTRMTNITWRPVELGTFSTSDSAFTALSNLGSQKLGPGETARMEMQFAARTSGPRTGTMEVHYLSDKPRSAKVELDARGGRPALALAPVAIDFGELPVGAKVERVVRLTNVGTTGSLHFQGVKGAAGDIGQFSASAPFRGKQPYPYNPGSAWPNLTAPDVPIAPGADYLDINVYFEPTATGDFRATLGIQSDDLFNPVRTIVVTGRAHDFGPCTFRVLPQPRMDFGNVPTGYGAVLGFRFENTGAAECAVKNIHLANDAGGAFFMPGGALTGGVVYKDDAFAAQIAFKTHVDGTYAGELELTVNNPTTPVVRLPLAAVATASCLTAAPNFLDFGPIRYDCASVPRRTLISNQCRYPISVTGLWLGTGTSDQFSVGGAPAFPVTLAPAQGFEVQVDYTRSVLGQHFTPLYVQAQSEGVPLLVPLLAETNHDGLQLERFVQGTDGQLDVLFVVSNTTTMGPFQDRLKAAIPGWMARAGNAGVDLHVAVTSTGLVPRSAQCGGGANGGEAGRLFPIDGSAPRVVAGTDAAAVGALQTNLGVGQCHNLVQGLETMRQALSSPLVDHVDDPRTAEPNDGNEGFLRSTARLAVVFLADEDDHSGFDTTSYTQLLQAMKGTNMGHRTSAYAIVPTSDRSCTTAGGPGARFSEVATRTGGAALSVCSPDYASLLDPLASRAAGAQRDFRLSSVPVDPAGIIVKVDGVTQGAPRWRFDARSNSIVFDVAAVPAAGQTVEVRYRSACGG